MASKKTTYNKLIEKYGGNAVQEDPVSEAKRRETAWQNLQKKYSPAPVTIEQTGAHFAPQSVSTSAPSVNRTNTASDNRTNTFNNKNGVFNNGKIGAGSKAVESGYTQQKAAQRQNANRQTMKELFQNKSSVATSGTADTAREATLRDLTIGSFKRGYLNARHGEELFDQMMGQQNEADEYAKKLAADEYNFAAKGKLGGAVSGVAEQIGQQARQWTNPDTLAMAGTAAGMAAIAGQAGPQVLLPEEVITVPGAFAAGMSVGGAKSNLEIEAGHAYREMLDNGVSESTAKKIAMAVGVGNAALELVQLDELAKSFKVLSKSGASDTLLQTVMNELKRRGVDVAKETAQEVAQEGVTIAGTQAGSKIDKGDWAYSAGEVAERLGDTAVSSALTFGLMNAPGGVHNVYTQRQGVNGNKKSSPLIEESETASEVPAKQSAPAAPVQSTTPVAVAQQAQPEQQTAEEQRTSEEVERIIEAFTTDDGRVDAAKQQMLIKYHGEEMFYRAVTEAFRRGEITNDGAGNIYSLRAEEKRPGYYGPKSKESKYLDAMAKAAGMTIHRGDLPSGEGGYYINGRAVLAEDAGVEIARHEVAHHLKQAAPEEFNAFLDYVKGVYGGKVDAALEVIRSDYAEWGEVLSDATAEEELAAFYAGKLLTDETAMKRLARENLSLSERLLSWLKESLAKIRRAFGGESVEAKRLREATALFENAIRAAKDGAVTADGVVSHAIERTTDNRRFVLVENDILDGVPEADWVSEVKRNLKQKFPNGITVGNNQIIIDEQSRKEMTYSRYMQWLYNNDPQMQADKLRATDNADEILLAATDWVNEGLNHPRKDKIADFSRGKVLLRIGGNDYQADVVVGTRKNGEMVLYDVLNLKNTAFTQKETDAAISTNPSPGAARSTAPVSNSSIPASAGKSNTNSSSKRSAYNSTAEKLDELQRLQRQNERLNKKISALEHEVRLEKAGGTTDREATKKLAKDIMKRYDSKVDVDALTGRMVDLYDRTMRNELSQAEMKEIAQGIARYVLDGSVAQINTMYEEYEDLRKELRGTKLKLESEDRADLDRVDGYENFRKRNMGKFILSNNGVSVDAVYEGLSERYPTLFPDDIYTPADQLIQISDVLDEMKPVMGNPFEGNTAATEFLANDILESFFDIPTTRTAELQRIQMKYDRQRQADREATDQRFWNWRRRMEQQRQKDREAADKRFAESRQRQRERIDQIMQKNAEKERERRAKATASERRTQLMKGTERLTKKLVRPDDKRHIPAEMRETVRAFVSMVNTESGFEWVPQKDGTYKRVSAGVSPDGVPTGRTLRARELQALLSQLEKDSGGEIDPQLQANLNEIAELGETKVADMDRGQLDLFYETMRAIEKMCQNSDKMLGDSKFATVSKVANELLEESRGRKTKTQWKKPIQMADDLAELDMMTPETFFHKLGRAGDELFRQMRRSADKQTRILAEGVEHAKKAIENSGLDIKKLESEVHEFELESGEKLTMTTAQIMNLHEAWKREQARDHIGLGGIKPTKIESGKGLKATAAVISEKVTLNDLANILKVLTPEQKALVDDLQKFMSGDLARHGNEASRETYGYDKFTEPDYWPIAVNKAEVESDPAKAAQAKTIVGFGMAKATKPKASNGLEIGSFMDVYTKHLSEMATYASWLATSENLTRVNNFKFTDAEGKPTGQTVKTILEKLYGKGGDAYWQKLMGDIAQGTKTGSDGTIMDKITGNTKAAAVGANIRVILQQPTSILRATSMIHPKYFVDKPHKGGWKKALKYSGIAKWKDWGYFEMDTGRSVRGLITGPEGKVEKWRERSMALAGKADSATWGALWNAVERETAAKHPELGGEALYEATAERFGEVIDRTQVVDSVLHRSQIMRKGGLNKMATSFMSEPMKTYNMVLRDLYDINAAADGPAKVRAARKLVGTATALTASFVFNALAQSIVDAARDDDRDQKYWEKFAEAFVGFTGEEKTLWDKHKAFWSGNVQGNYNPFSYVPYAKDIVSIIQGYDVTRMDMDAVSDAVQAFRQFWKTVQDEHNRIKPQEDYEDKGQKTMFNAGFDLSCELLAAVGLPLANVKRDLLAGINTAFSLARSYRMQYELDKVLYDIDYAGNRKRWWKILYAASQDNWEDYVAIYNDMLKQGLSEAQIKKGMEGVMKEVEGVDKVTELPFRWTPPGERSVFNSTSKQVSEIEGPKKALDLGWW